MIRRSTVTLLLVAIGLGFGLFRLTYEVQTLEGELSRLNRAITAEREATHVLQAEWSYLNEPTRLEALSKKHLGLHAAQDVRVRVFAELPPRQDVTPPSVVASSVVPPPSTAPSMVASPWGAARPTLAAGKPLRE